MGFRAHSLSRAKGGRRRARASFRAGASTQALTRIGRDAFLVQIPGFTDPVRVEFVRGADGKVLFLHHRLRAQKKIA